MTDPNTPSAKLVKHPVKNPPLVPVKTFYLPLTAIQGAPYFPDEDK